ncbi:MAG: segregation/condensation protein A [Candidatus Omnitrophica bacterium]|nr:segregation/condensation protein A [Candidatus Omnitrophota bacterium]
MSYKIKLEIFEGPFDLLLYLVKKEHINIYDIPIAKITDEYMRYLELMRLLDLKIAGEFLVMASTLLQIKSKMLLPAEEVSVNDEDEVRINDIERQKQQLIEQLLEYERFKQIAEELRNRHLERQKTLTRSSSFELESKILHDKERYFEASLFDLLNAFSKVLKDTPLELFYEAIKDEFTVEDKIHEILHLLLDEEVILLSNLFSKAKNKLEIIVTFLAILELIRLKEIKAIQQKLFGEIEIIRNNNNIIPYVRRKD